MVVSITSRDEQELLKKVTAYLEPLLNEDKKVIFVQSEYKWEHLLSSFDCPNKSWNLAFYSPHGELNKEFISDYDIVAVGICNYLDNVSQVVTEDQEIVTYRKVLR